LTNLDVRADTAVLDLRRTAPDALDVVGELDIASAPLLASCITEQLADPTCSSVRLNLSDVNFIDCAGLGVLLQARLHALAAGKRVVIDRAGPRVRQFLQRTGTVRVLLAG
jgi:anti-sigma B factor antagonist